MDSASTMSAFFSWFEGLMRGFSDVWGWLNSPLITLGDVSLSPLSCIGFAGIALILGYAVVKWLLPL